MPHLQHVHKLTSDMRGLHPRTPHYKVERAQCIEICFCLTRFPLTNSMLNIVSGVRGDLKLSIWIGGVLEVYVLVIVDCLLAWRTCKKSLAQVLIHRAALHTLMAFSRLDAFARGQIHGLRQAGKPRSDITKLVEKRDGSHPTLRAVNAVLRKKPLILDGAVRTPELEAGPGP